LVGFDLLDEEVVEVVVSYLADFVGAVALDLAGFGHRHCEFALGREVDIQVEFVEEVLLALADVHFCLSCYIFAVT
jgi:hypothetical protein